LTAVAWVR